MHLHRKVRWPHPFGLPGSVLSPLAQAARNFSCEVVVERALGAATGPGRQEKSGLAPRLESLSQAETQHPSACGCACPAGRALLLRAASPEDPWGPGTLLQPADSQSCQELPAGVRKLFPSPRADQTARLASRAWDGAPRLGTPCSPRHERTVGDPHLVPRLWDSPSGERRASERPFKALRAAASRAPSLPQSSHNALSPGSEATARQRLLIH